MFIRFDRFHERDGQTHRQTPHDNIGRACIASRGKNDGEERFSRLMLQMNLYTLKNTDWS